MRVLFLHLSDLHLKKFNYSSIPYLKKIAESINRIGSFDKCVIVFSGDITHSGEANQFIDAGKVLGHLIRGIRLIKDDYIDVLCVPGNHDIYHGLAPLSHADLQSFYDKDCFDEHLDDELKKLNNFFNLSKRNKCFESPSCLSQRILKYDGFSIEVNMINTGVFSLMKEEDKGLHYLPEKVFAEIKKPTGSDFVITIMHHAPEWYLDSQKHDLEKIIFEKSSIVFYGHEHFSSNKELSNDDIQGNVLIQCGGALSESEDWSHSSFFLGVLDTESLEYQQQQMTWNSDNQLYLMVKEKYYSLTKKTSNTCVFSPSHQFLEELKNDENFTHTKDFRDFFVFPRIRADDISGKSSKELVSFDGFKNELYEKKGLVLNGDYSSGKTTLLKYLFLTFQEEYCVLFCSAKELKGNRPERIIKNCFVDIYGDDPVLYERFMQLPKNKRMLLLDNIDDIETKDFKNLLLYIKEIFEFYIFTTKEMIGLNLPRSLEVYFNLSDLSVRYQLLPFFADKREELITKTVNLLCIDQDSSKKTIRALAEAISLQKKFISLTPEFIIKYVDYYYKNIGDISESNPGIFSKVFEASITNQLQQYASANLSVDKMYTILSLIAYEIHFSQKHVYPIGEDVIINVMRKYNEEYDSDINYSIAIKSFLSANILRFDAEKNGYLFSNRNYLSYFVARELNRRFQETGDEVDLRYVLEYSCFGINSDILMFLTYITDNTRILKLILCIATEYTKDWVEFDFENNIPRYLTNSKIPDIALPTNNSIEEEKQAETEIEKSESEIQIYDIYDYSEEEVDFAVNQIIRACALQITVARCLPSFEHLLKKEEKKQFIDLIYSLPNRIFLKWASLANEEVAGLVTFIKHHSKQYDSDKNLTDEKIVRALQWLSMSLLLELYNISVAFSAKENTFRQLENIDYHSHDTYAFERLMVLEKSNKSNLFIDAAKELDFHADNSFKWTLFQRIIRHGIIHMDSLSQADRQRLQANYLPSRSGADKLLIIEHNKAKNR